jgi:hypothetical protein
MASYQDLSTRIETLEKKMEFVMRSFTVARPHPLGPGAMIVKNLLDLYLEVMSGIPLDIAVNGEKKDGVLGEDNRAGEGREADLPLPEESRTGDQVV